MASGDIMNTSNEREVTKMNEREVKGMNETIKVEDIVKKINLHVSALKRGDEHDTECSKKIVSCLFNTLILMLDITYDEAITLVGVEDLCLFM